MLNKEDVKKVLECLNWTKEDWKKWKQERGKKDAELKKRGLIAFDDSVESVMYPGEED